MAIKVNQTVAKRKALLPGPEYPIIWASLERPTGCVTIT